MLFEMVLDVSGNFCFSLSVARTDIAQFRPQLDFARFQLAGKKIMGLHDVHKKFAIKIICFMID